MTARRGPFLRRLRRGLALGAAALALGAGGLLAQAMFDFMPDGGRGLFVQVFGDEADGLANVASLTLPADDWQGLIRQRDTALSESAVMTLASYLAQNFPLPEPAALAGLDPAALAAALPRDGKDLAIRYCQGCHGFYTGYVGHDRDMNGWMVMFNSPFHTEIRMNRAERLTFAHYSAINLPIPIKDVPPDLRH